MSEWKIIRSIERVANRMKTITKAMKKGDEYLIADLEIYLKMVNDEMDYLPYILGKLGVAEIRLDFNKKVF